MRLSYRHDRPLGRRPATRKAGQGIDAPAP
jgi:hypothetical protein